MPADSVPHPWRRFLRFSVRGLIALVLVIGVWLGWIVRQAHIQRDAVAAIWRTRGNIHYDWEWSNGNPLPDGKPWAPRWLVALIGVDYFGRVTAVDLRSFRRPKDVTLADVRRLIRLHELYVNSPSVSDAELEHLKGLTNLSVLRLYGTRVSDTGVVSLKGLTNLSVLDLRDTQVTDAGLAQLKGLTNLKKLDLHGTRVTDAGIEGLMRALPRLTVYR
jgi:Leucine-rich repeat (LRR) protein